jgi:alkane 1-monooxygenase
MNRLAVRHLVGFAMPVSVLLGAARGGFWTFQTPLGVFLAVPILDLIVGAERDRVTPSAALALNGSIAFKSVIWAWVPIQLALLIWAARVAALGHHAPEEFAGFTLSVGLTTGCIGVTFAHELLHRHGRFERALADVLLLSVTYPHFRVAHIHGHHRHVGTEYDCGTARFGENIYRFLVRALFGNILIAWRVEATRARRRAQPPYDPRNRMIRYGVTLCVMYGVIWRLFGARGLVFWAAQSGVAIFVLEATNYLQHYGLMRPEGEPGSYLSVQAHHSWDSSHQVTNWTLINLAHHADHHLSPSKSYETLRHLADAPRLPAGYSTMMLLAMVPPLWRKVMDPHVVRWRMSHGSIAATQRT